MRISELEAIKQDHAERLAAAFYNELEIEAAKMESVEALNEEDGAREPTTWEQFNEEDKEAADAVRRAALTVYEKISFDPFYKFIIVDMPEKEADSA